MWSNSTSIHWSWWSGWQWWLYITEGSVIECTELVVERNINYISDSVGVIRDQLMKVQQTELVVEYSSTSGDGGSSCRWTKDDCGTCNRWSTVVPCTDSGYCWVLVEVRISPGWSMQRNYAVDMITDWVEIVFALGEVIQWTMLMIRVVFQSHKTVAVCSQGIVAPVITMDGVWRPTEDCSSFPNYGKCDDSAHGQRLAEDLSIVLVLDSILSEKRSGVCTGSGAVVLVLQWIFWRLTEDYGVLTLGTCSGYDHRLGGDRVCTWWSDTVDGVEGQLKIVVVFLTTVKTWVVLVLDKYTVGKRGGVCTGSGAVLLVLAVDMLEADWRLWCAYTWYLYLLETGWKFCFLLYQTKNSCMRWQWILYLAGWRF